MTDQAETRKSSWWQRLRGRAGEPEQPQPDIRPEPHLPEIEPEPPPRGEPPAEPEIPADLPPDIDEPGAPPEIEPEMPPELTAEARAGWFARWRRPREQLRRIDEPEEEPEGEPGVEPDVEPGPTREPEPGPEPEEEEPAEEDEPVPLEVPEPMAKPNWFARLRSGLAKSSSRLTQGITELFTKRKLDDEALEELEELLITADLGVATAARVTARLARTRFNQEVGADEVRAVLAEEIAELLEPVARPLEIDPARRPHVVLVVGVNGSGKTTTIGKLARQLKDEGRSVTLAAGDTFRAAAVEQLKVWGQRAGCPVISRAQGADAAGLAFDALREAQARDDDVLLIDTAGRLQNKTHLMAELQKIVRVLRKQDQTAPHSVLLVLDATVGQNAHSQVEVFREMTEVTGLVLTKLDGTARGGVLVALAEKFKLPVHAIGVGESADDLRPFEARAFARSLMGLEA